MTDLERARESLRKAQDEARAVIANPNHTALQLAVARLNLQKATYRYAEMVRGNK
jgi:flagellar biosynthesis protein FlhB